MRTQLPPEDRKIFDSAPSQEKMLDDVRAGAVMLSQIIAGVQMAINDFNVDVMEDAADGGRMLKDFLPFYTARHEGRHYFDDVEDPRKLAGKILRRGKIRTETEWYLVKEITTDLEQAIFSAEDLMRLESMMAAFEQDVRRS